MKLNKSKWTNKKKKLILEVSCKLNNYLISSLENRNESRMEACTKASN